MEEVRKRIGVLQDAPVPAYRPQASRRSLPRSVRYRSYDSRFSIGSTAGRARTESTHQPPGASPTSSKRFMITDKLGETPSEKGCRLPSIPFCAGVVAAVMVSVLSACIGMYSMVDFFTLRFADNEYSGCETRVHMRQGVIDKLAHESVTIQQTHRWLQAIVNEVKQSVVVPSDRAVDAVLGSMTAEHHFDEKWTGMSAEQRLEIAYRAWVELSNQWECSPGCGNRSLGAMPLCGTPVAELFATFPSGQYSGFSLREASESGSCSSTMGLWRDGAGAEEDELVPLAVWEADGETGRATRPIRAERWSPATDPAISAQQALVAGLTGTSTTTSPPDSVVASASMLSSAPKEGLPRGQRVWSGLHAVRANALGHTGGWDGVAMTWTAPVTYCGDYSCLTGAVGATVMLKDISFLCWRVWWRLRAALLDETEEARVELTPQTSSIFVVNQMSDLFPEQDGLLIASAADEGSDGVAPATNASQPIVRLAAQALREKLGGWGTASQRDVENPNATDDVISFPVVEDGVVMLTFSWTRAAQGAENTSCDESSYLDGDCMQVAATSLRLDDHTQWLLGMVLPVGTFGAAAVRTRATVERRLERLGIHLDDYLDWSRFVRGLWLLGVIVVSLLVGIGVGALVSRPLGRLSDLMRRLGDLDFAHDSDEFWELHPGRRSRIRDVRELQEAFRRLSRGTEAFIRFVPATVVQNIIHGEKTATQLNVSQKCVTIMNSDIEGFTRISESLEQRDLLFVLTRYLSVMTRVVETYEGVVSEIQGDGLIVFWNAPDPVDFHAMKACAAGLAQQHAVTMLNAEFKTLGLPKLTVRIGLHTGEVMSGNIGSRSKMKFGCLGEPMKVAASLQEFCKTYGAQVICSYDTYNQVEPDAGFHCRRLAHVREVKRGEEFTLIYEVLGRNAPQVDPAVEAAAAPVVAAPTDGAIVGAAISVAATVSCASALASRSTEKSSGLAIVEHNQSSAASTDLKSASSVVSEAIRRSTSSLASPQAPLWRPIRQWLGKKNASVGLQATIVPSEFVQSLGIHGASGSMHTLGSGAGGVDGNVATAVRSESRRLSDHGGSCEALHVEAQVAPCELDVVTDDQRRRTKLYEQALDAYHSKDFCQAQTLAETLLGEVEDSAAARLAERARLRIREAAEEGQREEPSVLRVAHRTIL